MCGRQSCISRFKPILILAIGLALIVLLIPGLCAGRAVSLFPIDAAKSQEGAQEVVRQLAPGETLSESLSKNKKVVVIADLGAGQFLHLNVVPSGIQTSVQVIDPLGKALRKVQRPYSSEGPVSVFLAARVRGRYRFEVTVASDTGELAGSFTATTELLRTASKDDQAASDAQDAFESAMLFDEEGTGNSLKKALTEFERALSFWIIAGEKDGQAETLMEMGSVYYDLGENQKGLDVLTRALPLFRSVRDLRGEAACLDLTGETEDAIGREHEALEHYTTALKMRKELGDKLAQAETLNNIGVVHDSLGDEQKALSFFEASRAFKHDLGLQHREGTTLSNMCGGYFILGDMEKALEYCRMALAIHTASHNHKGEGAVLNKIANVYLTLGDINTALDYYRRALQAAELAGDNINRATVLNNIGLALFFGGRYQEALGYFQQSLPLRRVSEDQEGEAITLNNLGRVYGALGHFQQEIENYQSALTLVRNVGDRRWEANLLNNLAAAYNGQANYLQSLSLYKQALPLTKEVGDIRAEAKSLCGIARVEYNRGNLREAQAAVEESLPIVDSLRTKVANPSLRSSYFATLREPYDFYVDLLMQMHKENPTGGYDVKALEAGESSRAHTLLEMLRESHADVRTGVDVTLAERERSLQQLIDRKREIQVSILSGKHTEAQAATLRKDLEELLTEYEELEGQIRASSPKYASLTQPHAITLKEIQDVLGADTLLLEYALGQQRSYLWVVDQSSLSSFDLPSQNQISSVARHVYESLTERNCEVKGETSERRRKRLAKAEEDYRAAAAKLSATVLGPVANQLGSKRLVVVADGALQYVPFQMLPLPEQDHKVGGSDLASSARGVPLITEHEIVSLPSASVLAVLRRESAGRRKPPKQVAILADPVFDRNDSRVLPSSHGKARADKGSSGSTHSQNERTPLLAQERLLRSATETRAAVDQLHFQRLPFTRREAEEVNGLALPGQSLQALDFKASRTTAMSAELAQYRIVHFATHGLLDSDHPELSGLVFSLVDEYGKQQNGFLELRDIYNLNLPVDLVVLSACETALGKEIKGEGLVGLTRGFMYAGAPSVVASLWKVDDLATADLMGRFYRGMLKENMRPAAALRQAQLEMWKQKRWRDPYYWSAFTIQGEWQ